MKIQWIGSRNKALFSAATEGLQAQLDCLLAKDMAAPALTLRALACDALVIELGDAHSALDLAWIQNFFKHPSPPLTLVLTSHKAQRTATELLNAGADRCMPGTSDVVLVRAMLRAMVQRVQAKTPTFCACGPLRFEPDTHTLFHATDRVPLTRRETLVAALLFRDSPRHVRHHEIFEALAAQGPEVKPALVSLYAHRINKKIMHYGVHIAYTRGFGYKLCLAAQQVRAPLQVGWLGAWPIQSAYLGTPQASPRHALHA